MRNTTVLHTRPGQLCPETNVLLNPTRHKLSVATPVLQVGCTPEEPGFRGGPADGETDATWCPCSVPWAASFLGQSNFFQLSPGDTYPIVDDLYGPLIGFTLLYPQGSDLSLLCLPLTPPSQSPEAQVQQGSAEVSRMEDTATSLMLELSALTSSSKRIEDTLKSTDDEIESQVKVVAGCMNQASHPSGQSGTHPLISLLVQSYVG